MNKITCNRKHNVNGIYMPGANGRQPHRRRGAEMTAQEHDDKQRRE